MSGFTLLWALGLFLLLKVQHPGGSGTSTVIGYVALLIPAFFLYAIARLLFLPFRR